MIRQINVQNENEVRTTYPYQPSSQPLSIFSGPTQRLEGSVTAKATECKIIIPL